ncbi:hypothetical protein YC2023_023366 [Brassica napus]
MEPSSNIYECTYVTRPTLRNPRNEHGIEAQSPRRSLFSSLGHVSTSSTSRVTYREIIASHPLLVLAGGPSFGSTSHTGTPKFRTSSPSRAYGTQISERINRRGEISSTPVHRSRPKPRMQPHSFRRRSFSPPTRPETTPNQRLNTEKKTNGKKP